MAARHRAIRQTAAVISLVGLWACGGGGGGGGGGPQPTPATLSSVGVTGDRPNVEVGSTLGLKATASYSDASTRDVTAQATWTSDPASTATVSAAGVVTGVTSGAVKVRATFEGKTGEMDLTVNPPPLTARFTVRTNNAGDRDVCRIKSDGDLDCFFDGTASGPNATRWSWTWAQGNKSRSINSNSPISEPNTNCGLFDTSAPQAGTGFVQMIVRLKVGDAAGRESAELVNANVRMFPQNRCGFGF